VVYQQAGMTGGGPQMVEEVFGDWKEVGGVKFAHLITISQGGRKAAESRISELKVNTGLSAEELAKKP